MKFNKFAILFCFILSAGTCWGYGGTSSGTASCKKPQFSNFIPPNHAEVAPGSDFSLEVSRADPATIQVTVKQQPVAVTVTPKNNTFQVTGRLPENLKGTYARIDVSASGSKRCQASGGWLVKISD